MNRTFRLCRWVELGIGAAVIVPGVLSGGCLLPALGAYLMSLSAVCAAEGKKIPAAIQAGLTLPVALWTGVGAFFHTVRVSRYASGTSPLWAVIVVALCLLGQAFLTLPTEDQPALRPLRRELIASALLCAFAFAGVVLTYALGLHYTEGAVAAALSLSGCRLILRAFLTKTNPLTEERYV